MSSAFSSLSLFGASSQALIESGLLPMHPTSGGPGGALWNSTFGYGATAPRVAFLDQAQNFRLERIRVSRMLWRGWHRQAYLEEHRTQFNFKPMKIQGGSWIPYIGLNVLHLVSTTLTDLLLGDEPLMRVDDELGQNALEELIGRSNLHSVFYQAATESSWASEATVEICRWGGEVYVSALPPAEVFPIGSRNPDGQYSQYRRFAVDASNEVKPRPLLMETTCSPGKISRQCFFLDGTAKGGNASLSLWPTKQADGSDLADQESTGIEENSIVWLANELDEGKPTSDYDRLIALQDELNHKQTQIAIVLAKHGDPKLAAPAKSAVPSESLFGGSMFSDKDVFYFRTKDDIPSYITWNAELGNAIADRDFTLNAFCMVGELSPVLLGIRQGATPDAARKLRLEATKSLARAKRKAANLRPFIRTTLDRALEMEARGKLIFVAMEGSSVELRDGLPVDEIDKSTAMANYRAAGVMSIERGVEQQIADPAGAAQEVQRIKDEKASAAPAFFGRANGQEPGEEIDKGTRGQGEEESGDGDQPIGKIGEGAEEQQEEAA